MIKASGIAPLCALGRAYHQRLNLYGKPYKFVFRLKVEPEYQSYSEGTMPEEDDIAKKIQERVRNEFQKMQDAWQDFSETKHREFDIFDREQREKMELRLKELEDRVSRDVRTRVFSIVLLVVTLAAGAMLAGSFAATREVNNAVISLQNSIIEAGDRINSADDALRAKVKEVDDTLSAKVDKINEAAAALAKSETDLQAAQAKFFELSNKADQVLKSLQKP